MISNQVIQTSIDELKTITRIDLCVIDMVLCAIVNIHQQQIIKQQILEKIIFVKVLLVGDHQILNLGCYLTAVEQKNIILIKEVGALDAYGDLHPPKF